MELRTLTAKHLQQLSDLEQTCFSDPWEDEVFRELLILDGIYWGIFDGPKLVAYMLTIRIKQGLHIANLAVDPVYRRQQIARRLFHTLYETARQEHRARIFLEARSSNFSAIKLYLDETFWCVGNQPRYYPDGESALVFLKQIDLKSTTPSSFPIFNISADHNVSSSL